MPIKITKTYVVEKRLYIADGKLVDPDRKYAPGEPGQSCNLFANEGDEIPLSEAVRLGLVTGDT